MDFISIHIPTLFKEALSLNDLGNKLIWLGTYQGIWKAGPCWWSQVLVLQKLWRQISRQH